MIFKITHNEHGFIITGNAPERLSIHGYQMIKKGSRFYVLPPETSNRIVKAPKNGFAVTKAHLLERIENWFDEPSALQVKNLSYKFSAENLQKQLELAPESLRAIYLDLLWDSNKNNQ